MFSFFHSLFAVFFYVLGSSFFIAYAFFQNNRGGVLPLWWMTTADLPLMLCTLIYGGLSLYRSLHSGLKTSYVLIFTIAIPLITLAILTIILNFWGTVPL
ncbi:hypothetical protein HYZ98_04610 [Candidatus Peregrinibacteria bacterium]|nr:hypothetical protein [Candidatus Peregrinibacteria bacterium]